MLSYEAIHDLKAMLQERDNPTEGVLFVSTTKGKVWEILTPKIRRPTSICEITGITA